MATLTLTGEQGVELVKQFPAQSKPRVLMGFTAEREQWRQTAAAEGAEDMRRLEAARGLNRDSMTEVLRETH